MTEYEIADFAASKVMQVEGLFSGIQVQIASVSEGIQQFMTILFAYLAAAYFVGSRMDRVQVWLFTILYVFWQAWTMTAIYARGLILGALQDRFFRLTEIERTRVGAVPDILMTSSLPLLISVLLASLYFMWHVRRSKSE